MKNWIIKKERNNGITLIALVITIIVLLILAGVTIASITGENGILSKATSARDNNAKASAEERVKTEVLGSYGSDGNLSLDDLNKNLTNIEGLKYILKDGLISSWFIEGRLSKYPSSVGVWNLKQDYLLKDYINFYSGGTIEYKNIDGSSVKTEVIPYNQMPSIMLKIDTNICFRWYMEQTKEARFMPSLVQDKVQVGIIFDGQSEYMKKLLEGDILSEQINDKDVKEFVKPDYYAKFLVDRKKKDDFFTDRESAVLFGIPSCFIEGILVGRIYEKDQKILKEIKELLPDCYICNLDGKVIVE